jgi:hypothetical protein
VAFAGGRRECLNALMFVGAPNDAAANRIAAMPFRRPIRVSGKRLITLKDTHPLGLSIFVPRYFPVPLLARLGVMLKQHAGIDVQAMYPAGEPPKAERWTVDTFLMAAEACHKAGFPFGLGLGTTNDSVNVTGACERATRLWRVINIGERPRKLRHSTPLSVFYSRAQMAMSAPTSALGGRAEEI